MNKIPPIIFVLISFGFLNAIKIRRVIKGELSLFGLKQFMEASKIKLDTFDYVMIAAAGVSIFVFAYLEISS